MSASDDVIAQAKQEVQGVATWTERLIDQAAERALVALDALKGQESEPVSLAVIHGHLNSGGYWTFLPDERVGRGVTDRAGIEILGSDLTKKVQPGDYDLVVLVYPRGDAARRRKK